jgi:hypothetical protein
MPKKLLISLASVLALATFAMAPAAVAESMEYKQNGQVIGTQHENVTLFGPLTLKSSYFGEFSCKVVAGAPVWNEAGMALNAVEGWEPFVCKYTGTGPGCKQQSFVTAEEPVELVEETIGSEKQYKAKRGLRTMPWPGELFETTEKTKSLNMHEIAIYLDCPTEGLEVRYEGNLEPKYVNGVKNGLSPSKLVFEGKGGKTSYLVTCSLIGCVEEEKTELFVSGELSVLGIGQQLITAG